MKLEPINKHINRKNPIKIGNYIVYFSSSNPENFIWIEKNDGEGMHMKLDAFKELLDQVWKEF